MHIQSSAFWVLLRLSWKVKRTSPQQVIGTAWSSKSCQERQTNIVEKMWGVTPCIVPYESTEHLHIPILCMFYSITLFSHHIYAYAMNAPATLCNKIVEEDTIRLQSVAQNENHYVYCSFNTLTTRWVVHMQMNAGCMYQYLYVYFHVHVCLYRYELKLGTISWSFTLFSYFSSQDVPSRKAVKASVLWISKYPKPSNIRKYGSIFYVGIGQVKNGHLYYNPSVMVLVSIRPEKLSCFSMWSMRHSLQ